MKSKRLFANTHKWIGLSMLLFIAVQSVTGLVLTFRSDLLSMRIHRSMDAAAFMARPTVSQIHAKIRETDPDHRISRIVFPQSIDNVYLAYLEPLSAEASAKTIDFTAGDDQVILRSGYASRILEFIFELHHAMHIKGVLGRYLTGIVGIALLILLISGLTLWWPGIRRIRGSLRIQRKRNPITFFWQFHRTSGAVGSLVLLVLAVTGIALAFGPELRNAISGESLTDFPEKPDVLSCAEDGLDRQVVAAKAVFPSSQIRDVRFDVHSGGISRVLFYNQTRVGIGPPDQVWLTGCTGTIDRVSYAPSDFSAQGVLAWAYPVHVGLAVGRWSQALIFFGGLMALMSVVTALKLTLGRRTIKKAKRKQRE